MRLRRRLALALSLSALAPLIHGLDAADSACFPTSGGCVNFIQQGFTMTSKMHVFPSKDLGENPIPESVLSGDFSLTTLIDHIGSSCWEGSLWPTDGLPLGLGYLAVAHSGSLSCQEAIQMSYPADVEVPHNHQCTFRDLESLGAQRLIVPLRDPLARILSGVGPNSNFEIFNDSAADEFVSALRQKEHPMHQVAMQSMRRPFMYPIVEFYLANASEACELGFVCTDTLSDDFYAVARSWDLPHPYIGHLHASSNSSSDAATTLEGRFSEENARWIREVYAEDVHLVAKHCGRDALWAPELT